MRTLFLIACAALSAAAQPRTIEVFGSIRAFRAAGDEGRLGNGPGYGGAVMVGLTERFAIDLDVQTAQTELTFGAALFRLRRTLVMPSFLFRWGSNRVYGFAGGGIGGLVDRTLNRDSSFLSDPGPPWVQVSPGVFEFRGKDSGWTKHARGGLVAAPAGRLLLRADVFASWRFVLPDMGVTFGVGYRF